MNLFSKTFRITIFPKLSDFDQMGHINNVVYLQWVQDIAEAHWTALGNKEILNNFIWVALRHEIDYKKEIRPDEPITAETFVASMEGVKSERITHIFRSDTKELKAEAKTYWCLLNAETKRPLRINEELKKLFI